MTDLLGDPLPDYTPDLPHDEALGCFEQLVGHTIKAAFASPGGKRNADIVIVTETGCYIAASAEMDGCCSDDGASMTVHTNWYGTAPPLSDYLSPRQLFGAGLCTQAEHDLLQAKVDEEKRKFDADQARRLRERLARLEADSATPKG